MVTSVLNRFSPIDFTRYIDRLTDRFTGREWLFKQIDQWLHQGNEQFYLLTGEPGVGKSAIAARLTQLREDIVAYHFCRAGDVETVRPGRVLRSIAAQLGKTLPHYGEALKKTIDPIYLRVEVNINIGSLSNSQVTGMYVENLKEIDPRDELELLLRAPLAALPDLYAAHNEPLPALKVFLIDSLDEAVTTTGRDNLATLLATLSQAEGLPSWIRFILTARPDLRVLQQFESLKLYKLEELLAQNLGDIEQYVQNRIQELVVEPELDFQARLDQAQLSAEALVHEVRELSKGNFLYTRLVMNGIGSEELSLKNLSALPKTLNEVYQRLLRHRCPFRKWINRYQPILGTLTVTQEGISQEQLVKFTGIDAEQIQGAISILQQFLDEVENDEGQKLYAIFHQSLREYLLDRKHNHDFWCDGKEQHDSIIDCFEKESESWQDLRAIDLYGLRHLAQHLVKGDRAEELHDLLGLEKNQYNAWFDAKESILDVAGFLSDIKLAWECAEQAFEKDKAKTIGRQCYYALIQSSLKHESEAIPPKLLVALIIKRKWSPLQTLTYAFQIRDPYKQRESILALIPHLPVHMLKEVFTNLASVLVDQIAEHHRIEILIGLAPYLPDALENVLDAIRSPITLFRYQALTSLTQAAGKVPYLPQHTWEELFDLACTMGDGCRKVTAITPLIPHLPQQLLEKALAIACQNAHYALTSHLVPYSPEILKEALTIARSIRHRPLDNLDVQYGDVDALLKLAPYAPEVLDDALATARSIPKEYGCAEALTKLIPYLPDLVWEAWAVALGTPEEPYRTRALIELIPHCPEVLNELWTGIHTLRDDVRAEALTGLAPHLSESMLEEALTIVDRMQGDIYRRTALDGLALYLPDRLLEKALGISRSIRDEVALVLTLIELASHLSDASTILEEALIIARRIRDNTSRADALISLVPHLPKVLPEALNTVRSVPEEYDRAMALGRLCSYLPDLLEEAWSTAQSIQSKYRVKAMKNLIPLWFSSFRENESSSNPISRVISRFLQPMQQKRVQHYLEETLSAVRSLPSLGGDPYQRTTMLIDLLSYKPNIQQEILFAVNSFRHEDSRTLALVKLVPYLPDVLDEALVKTRNLPNAQGERTYNLSQLIPYLPDLIEETLISIQDIKYEYNYVSSFKGLAPYLSEKLLNDAFDMAHKIQNDSYRASALAALYARLDPTSINFEFWSQIPRVLTYLERKDFLLAIPNLATSIISLSSNQAIPAITAVIQKVSRQWQ